MSKNNFQRLSDENITPRAMERIDQTTKEIDGSVSFVQMIGNIVEMYLPRVFDVFLLMGGAKRGEEAPGQEDNNLPPSAGGNGHFGHKEGGPSNPDL